MQQLKKELEQRFGCQLHEGYSSREDSNPDEIDGHFISYSIQPEQSLPEELDDSPPIINLYENGKVQFFHDATPYPVKANTRTEARDMMVALNPYPVKAELVDQQDYEQFIAKIIADYE